MQAKIDASKPELSQQIQPFKQHPLYEHYYVKEMCKSMMFHIMLLKK